MQNDERIPILPSKLKSNYIWSTFVKKTSKMGKIPDLAFFRHFLLAKKSLKCYPIFWPKTIKNWQNTLCCHFRLFLAKNDVKWYPISIMRPDSESSHQGASSLRRRVSDLKADNIWHFFTKNDQKLTKYPLMSVFDRFFLAKNDVKCYPILVMRPVSQSSHQGASSRRQNERDHFLFYFWPPIVISNLWLPGAG